ncbi:MAG: DUF481 domain-containing protein [Acidobacteriota bacterium]
MTRWMMGCGVCWGLLSGCAWAADEAPPGVTGEVDGHYSFNQASYTTRELSLAADVAWPVQHGELDGEFRFDREFIKLDGSPLEINTDKYDANIKYKYFLDDSPYYAYLSPRMRYNRFGYYQRAQSVRGGGGRKFGGSPQWEINLELGSGYREAHLSDDAAISETLYTMTVKARWAVSENLSLKFNWVNERSSREAYRTVTLGLRNKLTDKLGLKYEVLYRHTYPYDSLEKDGELQSEIGLSYSF